MNFTVTTKGTQFDRLGIMFLGDIEVFRTSTEEPTAAGVTWAYIKEMQQFDALWKTNQKIIFDLPNIVQGPYTGRLSTTLTATFFTTPHAPPTADVILPISAEKSGDDASSAWFVSDQPVTISHQFPQNVERAVVSLSANGQQAEEFWYTNVLSSDTMTFWATGALAGNSPFREIQLMIDGRLSGVSWPFPVIFTGGIVPGFWRPIVGIDAFDLRQHEIDITPWLPSLCDGAPHTFEIRVAGLDDDGQGHATLSDTVNSYWLITGTIFLFLGPQGSKTTGAGLTVDTPAPEIQITSSITPDISGANHTLAYTVHTTRSITVNSQTQTSRGTASASWSQNLSFTNENVLTSYGYTQQTIQKTTGADTSSSGYIQKYIYPLAVNNTFTTLPVNKFHISGSLIQGLSLNTFGRSIFPNGLQYSPNSSIPITAGALISTTLNGTAEFQSGSYTCGSTEQNFDFGAQWDESGTRSAHEIYHRHVRADNTTISFDEESYNGIEAKTQGRVLLEDAGTQLLDDGTSAVGSVRGLLGRGPA